MKLLLGFTHENIGKHCTVDPVSGCWNWNGSTSRGYGHKKLKGKGRLAHRLSYQLFNGEIPAGLQVMHKCDNRKCINPDHLTLGTNRDNQIDSMQKGRWKKPPTLFGTDHPGFKHGRYARS